MIKYIFILFFSTNILAFKDSSFFHNENSLNLELSGDFKTIRKEKNKNRSYDISIIHNKKKFPALIQVRGSNRLKECDFPLLKIDLHNKQKMKVVTQCNTHERAAWVQREYLMYKLYERLDPLSFKTKIAHITYRDQQEKDSSTQFSFFLETSSDFISRNSDFEKLEVDNGYDRKLINTFQLSKVLLFRYMINDPDINITSLNVRNVDLFKDKKNNRIYPIPFDFDFAMMVRNLDVTYLDYIPRVCGFDHELYKVRPYFIQHKMDFFQIIKSAPYLSDLEKTKIQLSLTEFFRRIENEASFKQLVENSENCIVEGPKNSHRKYFRWFKKIVKAIAQKVMEPYERTTPTQ